MPVCVCVCVGICVCLSVCAPVQATSILSINAMNVNFVYLVVVIVHCKLPLKHLLLIMRCGAW